MTLLFFNAAGTILFVREDTESASVTHEQMQFQAVFPFDKDKEVLRGMRVGYEDALGVFQVYEVRKVRTLEPDHMQEIGAEHIVISELTDEYHDKKEWTNKTASEALTWVLTNTAWSVGTSTASNTSSYDMSRGDVWSAVKGIEHDWNVYILPRVTVDATGITGKYLDIVPAGGTWRGLRLSLDKNANEIGVIWDDSNLKTALYGFGQEKNGTPLTFADVVWTETADHPAKPSGQTYLEDPAATAAYGRNGRPRFGYYQNASITNATTLLEKTWETLKTVNVPDVSINSTIIDLYRLGYADVPIRLHDIALVEIRPTGVVLQKEVIQYTENLLDPLQSRLSIGVYIPNIIYINRQANRRGGGGRGSGGQTWLEYTTENNTVQLTIDTNGLNSLCVGTGAQLNPDGSLVVDPDTGNPVFINSGHNLYSKISQTSSDISLIVSNVGANGTVTAASIVAAVNDSGSSVVIDADHIDLNGIVTAQVFETALASIDQLTGDLSVAGSVTVGGHLSSGDIDVESLSGFKVDGTSIGLGDAVNGFGTPTVSGGQVSIPYTTLSGGSGTINFNKAAAGTITGINQRQTAAYSTTDKEYTVYPTATGTDITNAPYDAQIFVSGSAAYNHGFTVAEAQYTLATVHLQGTAGTVYIEDSENGTSYYQRGSLFTAQGSAYGSITPIGTKRYYQRHAVSETPTGAWYSRHTSDPGGTKDTMYEAGTAITNLRNPGSTQYYAVNTSSKIVITTATRYTAGSTVSDTYYTKS